jgi:DNA-binding MarR family transcriptional regulator
MADVANRPDLLLSLMRAASGLAERINERVVADGHAELRPAHGLVFVRVSGGGATVSEIAEYLGVTKQSAGSIVDQLTELGYLTRSKHPSDGRAVLIELTQKGRRVTTIAHAAAVAEWEALAASHDASTLTRLQAVLDELGRNAPPRPVW